MLSSAQDGVLEPKYTQFTVTEEEGNQKISTCNKLESKLKVSLCLLKGAK